MRPVGGKNGELTPTCPNIFTHPHLPGTCPGYPHTLIWLLSTPMPTLTWYMPTSNGFCVSVSIVNLTSGEASCRAPCSARRCLRI